MVFVPTALIALRRLARALAPDRYTLCLLGAVALASFLPCTGTTALVLGKLASVAIGLLFFLHGARLPREAVIAGFTHWRLHLVVLALSFCAFPLIGLAMKPLALALLTPALYLGLLFICVLPSTIQASITMTSIARGNVPAAICSASASSFLGIFLTPLLAGMLLHGGGNAGASFDSLLAIVLQLLLPFTAGQLLRHWIGAWVDGHKTLLRLVDQGAILLVVYTAFSGAVAQGLWRQVPPAMLAGVVAACVVLLGVAMLGATLLSRRLGFSREDEIAIVFCGSKKSMATGVPMAKVLFASSSLGTIILPLLVFHQVQLVACAMLAQRYARRRSSS